ncbi:hypothetical protein SPJ1_1761 [Streptococcus parauberis KRS-02083]|uniref:Uncharacterized protein n=1 Tax=Streptococcus parauberis KRS-02083 TaxID=1207545 RepID=A0ABN0IPY3_9STRE|nr:hypothetical protein SPJ1_1761 [Streptococcus parauberis KRS-02083]
MLILKAFYFAEFLKNCYQKNNVGQKGDNINFRLVLVLIYSLSYITLN